MKDVNAYPYMGKDSNTTMVKVGYILEMVRDHIKLSRGDIVDHEEAIDYILQGAVNCLLYQAELDEAEANETTQEAVS